jgi:hypothetical protein
MPPGKTIGCVRFTDGVSRPVFRDPAGRQYVLDERGLPVFGVWLDPRQNEQADEPLVVQGPQTVNNAKRER